MSATEVNDKRQARRWCFTWNNYPDDWKVLLGVLKYKYIFCGEEIGESGTKHIQGYAEFNSGKRLITLKKANGCIHWEICKGNQEQNIAYCSKDSITWEDGDKGNQGCRSDLDELKSVIDSGVSMLSLAEDNFSSFVRYHKGLEKYQYMRQQAEASSKLREVTVEYWWGDTGTGKTYTAFTENPGSFMVSEGVTGFWWTGYNGQETIIMDEFRGNIPACQLLRILDIYPVQFSIHGGYVWCNAKKFIITSNVDFEDLYQGVDPRTKAALRRRITNIRTFVTKCDATEVAGGNTVTPAEKIADANPHTFF